MSMSLYLTAGPEAELMKLARDPDGLARMSMARGLGGLSAFGAPGAGALDEAAFERQLKQMGRAAWRQGVLVYCAEDPDDASKSELMDDVDANFPLLKDYVTAAAARGNALAIWMS